MRLPHTLFTNHLLREIDCVVLLIEVVTVHEVIVGVVRVGENDENVQNDVLLLK